MQDSQQFEQLILQYTHLRNGALDIKRMIEIEDFDSAMTMIKSREALFMNCKSMRRYLELTSEQEEELNLLLDEIKELEMDNIRAISKSMKEVQNELKNAQQNEKIQQAYDFNEDQKGSIVNIKE